MRMMILHQSCRRNLNQHLCALSLLKLQPNCYVPDDVSKCCLNSDIVVAMRVPMPTPMVIVTMPRLEQEPQTQVPIIA